MTDEQDSIIEARLRVKCIVRDQINYYHRKGIGERSKFAGCIITQKLIDALTRRFLQLGGSLSEIA